MHNQENYIWKVSRNRLVYQIFLELKLEIILLNERAWNKFNSMGFTKIPSNLQLGKMRGKLVYPKFNNVYI